MSTVNNDIPFVPENTTDPAAGLNLSLNVIDALLQIAVVAIQNTPPGAPTEGQRYIVGTAGTGDWAGQDNRLARYLDGAWSFYDARMAVNLSDGNLYVRNDSGWGVVTGGGGGGSGIVETVVAGTGISVDSTDPANPVVSATGGGGSGNVDAVVAGFGVTVDDGDPSEPIVSSNFAASNAAASYTLAATNSNQWMDLTGGGTIDVTCPPESSVDLGDRFVHIISNYNSGTVTIVAGSGVTVRPPAGGTLIVPQYATVGIKKADYAADTYIVFGPTQEA